MATRLQLNEDDKLNENDPEFTEVTLPASAPIRLSQARPLGLQGRTHCLLDRVLGKKRVHRVGKGSQQAVNKGKQRA
jgi:hypothetical protein